LPHSHFGKSNPHQLTIFASPPLLRRKIKLLNFKFGDMWRSQASAIFMLPEILRTHKKAMNSGIINSGIVMSGKLNQRRQPKPGSRKSASRKNPRRKNTKITGERSEAAFLNRAAGLGFGVAKPWGDSRLQL
jgi:hypothetical protein